MKAELIEQLIRKYPLLYRGYIRRLGPAAMQDKTALVGVACSLFEAVSLAQKEGLTTLGFEVDDGWFDIVLALSQKIAGICEEERITKEQWPAAVQVKEKFAGLRFYIDPLNLPEPVCKRLWAAIQEAEEKSYSICERCGKKPAEKKTKTHGVWIKTLCSECAKDW